MSNVIGMDIDAGRDLAAYMEREADEINAMVQRLTQMLEGTAWIGPDANAFRSDWSGSYVPTLHQVTDALKTNATTVRNQAADQERASS